MAGLPAAVYMGVCSGHGKSCQPSWVHATLPDCVPGPQACTSAPPKPIAAMEPYNIWPPFAQAPLTPASAITNVVVNGNIPIVDQDLLTNHPPTCSNTVVKGGCQPSPIPVPCPTQTICTEDIAGGGAHIRKATATSKTVFINGRRACRVMDPLGPPCLSHIATGAANVFIGV